MEIKDKIKKYKCRVCGQRYERLMSKTWQKWCDSEECKDAYIKKVLEKERKKKELQKKREWKKKKEEYKKALGIAKVDTLQRVINQIVMILDKDEPCLARPLDHNTRFEAGHVLPRGRHPALKYHLDNVHKQGNYSNRLQTDDLLMVQGLEVRYGKEYREYVESLPKRFPILKLTREEKKEAYKKAMEVKRRLKAGEKMSRTEINNYIGIYVEDKTTTQE